MERIGVNATFNAGAIEFHGQVSLVLRVEGTDRKSFFAVASLPTHRPFPLWDYPIVLPETSDPDINVYTCASSSMKTAGFMDFLHRTQGS